MTKPIRFRVSQWTRAKHVKSVENFLKKNIKNIKKSNNTLSIDLGSNSNPRNPFKADKVIGLDISNPLKSSNVKECNLFFENIPVNSGNVDYITAFDFIEHMPRIVLEEKKTYYPFINLMNEAYRVLNEGGLFLSVTPAYPYKEAFQDPTHTNIITEDTFRFYFTKGHGRDGECLAKIYGFTGEFKMIDQAWLGPHLITLLKK